MCSTALLLLTSFAGAARGAQLLAEYDFEAVPAFLPNWTAASAGTYKPATGWKSPFQVTLGQAAPHFGAKCLAVRYLESVPGNKVLGSPAIAIPPSDSPTRVRVRFFYRLTSELGGAVDFSVLGRREKGGAPRFVTVTGPSKSLPAAESWTEWEGEGQIEPGTRSVQLLWIQQSTDSHGELLLDDIAVERLNDQ